MGSLPGHRVKEGDNLNLRKGPEPKPDEGYIGKTERVNFFERKEENEDGNEISKPDEGHGESRKGDSGKTGYGTA